MSHDLLLAKIAYGFEQLDADGDGRLTENDHLLMGRASARALGHAEDSPEEQRLVAAYVAIWRDLHLPALPTGASSLSRADFIASTAALADDPAAARATVGALAKAFLALADTDGDGRIDPDEFFAFQRGHFPGLDRAASDLAFGHLDQDGDGVLSAEEFVTATIEYWSSRDPEAPGNWWAGNPALTRVV
ncbi:EF-hand domain-containing protein [Streptomyces genisteinicus]|uniref:EF-hand domain-containing protein n=1 Tax=Streptomyces genisteinicus TaxID=2768068 RepID=A0A7H0I1I3_9ACTN|nr:EF-hand domain-containing protein [Streptomyces genisteinicus]QNP66649.1 EF-hand domain-containing protein [Streptomyces genisteinicus]